MSLTAIRVSLSVFILGVTCVASNLAAIFQDKCTCDVFVLKNESDYGMFAYQSFAWAVPVRVGLCLSLLSCTCSCWPGRACLSYAVLNIVQLGWPLPVPLLFRNQILTLNTHYRS